MTPEQFTNFLNFYQTLEKLKVHLRHEWTSDPSRQTSVAEHIGSLTFIALYMSQHQPQFDLLKVLKMLIVHDWAEAITKDIPSFEKIGREEEIELAEKKAIEKILSLIEDKTLREELYEIWQEYEDRKTELSRYVKAIDKIDDIIQHNLSDISTWTQKDFDFLLHAYDKHFEVNEFMKSTKNEIDKLTVSKVQKAKQLDRLNQAELKAHLKQNSEN